MTAIPNAAFSRQRAGLPKQDSCSRSGESRRAERRNLFLSAVLYSAHSSSPGRIRNLSETGALVETSVLPSAGTTVRLCRGSLTVTGTVVWADQGKLGLRFDSTIDVFDWLPRASRSHQAHIDQIIHDYRASSPSDGGGAVPHVSDSLNSPETLASLLKSVVDSLACDPRVVAEHAWSLQQLDLAVDQLGRLWSNKK